MIDEKKLNDPAIVVALWKVAKAADGLRRGRECWCEVAVGSAYGAHTTACNAMTDALLDLQAFVRADEVES